MRQLDERTYNSTTESAKLSGEDSFNSNLGRELSLSNRSVLKATTATKINVWYPI